MSYGDKVFGTYKRPVRFDARQPDALAALARR